LISYIYKIFCYLQITIDIYSWQPHMEFFIIKAALITLLSGKAQIIFFDITALHFIEKIFSSLIFQRFDLNNLTQIGTHPNLRK